MSEQSKILSLLESGRIIRVLDGRCGDGFVDKRALDELIRTKQVKKFKNKGMEFVKAKEVKS